jgi:hypothetical protein
MNAFMYACKYMCGYMHIAMIPRVRRIMHHSARPHRPPHLVHDTACARAPPAPAALRLPPPLRLGRRTRPAATPLCAGRPQAYKSAHADTPSHARLLVTSASTRPPPPPLSARSSLPAADMHSFSAVDNAWTPLSPSGSGPSSRFSMGFAATPDGMLYVFGGWGDGNEGGKVICGGWGRLRGMPSCFMHVPHRCCLSLSEGTRVEREEICRHVCTYAAAHWAVYVQLQKELAIRLFLL